MDELSTKDKMLLKLLENFKETETQTYNYIVPLVFSKRIIYLDSIRRDLEMVVSIAESLLILMEEGMHVPERMNKSIIAPSLWYTLIITYARCFASGRAKLDMKDCFPLTEQGEKFRGIHTKIISIRNTFVAHREENEYEQSVSIMKLPKHGEKQSHTEYRIVSTKRTTPSKEELNEYLDIAKYLYSVVLSKIDKCKSKMHEDFFSIKT